MNPDQDNFLFYFEKLITFFSSAESADDLAQARSEYFSLINPVPPDGPLYESRLALFLDWFIFDRKFRDGKVAVQYFYETQFSGSRRKKKKSIKIFSTIVIVFSRSSRSALR